MSFASMHQGRKARQGFVLFEVIVALSIFALVAFSLVVALDSSFNAAMERNEIDVALRGLENQMELLHSARVLPGESDAPDDGTGILYHISVLQEQLQDQNNQPVPNTYRATITATWKFRGEAQERDVSELIYQP
jgi:prepilin-type N-terminal cleavage/methylation domain-containing protein